jgi:2-polyprenyl-6-methoxyphenol hydroxylase-like FAD-dependent oxidoreductase
VAAVSKVLVIGGGFSGMSAAIQLRKIGAEVDLVEIDEGWRSYGAGITINGSSLRAFGTIGVLSEILSQGFCADGVDLFTPEGFKVGELPTPRLAGPDVPGGGGIMRPALARILSQVTRQSGTRVRLGCTFSSISQSGQRVNVAFTDSTAETYDLVIGADGLRSKMREYLFPDAPKPRYTGQGVWRAVTRRPPSVTRPAMYMGSRVKAGVNPVSQEQMYLFVTEYRSVNAHLDDEELVPQLKAILTEFTAPTIATMRAELGPSSQIVFRPLDALLLPQPWFKGPVVLIGDAAHATTPHLAAGAGIGIEDAIVLAEELRHGDVSAALERFQQRRWERCRLVVENSVRLGEIEQTGGSKEDHTEIMSNSMRALAAPI